ncbi:zinc finger MYM-type protein 1-like [Rosa chinensis]|uniref:zinc finger MYM-type protein 1-like n=1 Tax=Rosa chinensis TaxID=74649 RepID=UPI000D0970E8|nr:zinc finger MYM-type protein 1-like [Rosa chinensis]
MAIILRFVDKEGFLRERFFDIVMVEDTTAETLHQEISKVLLHHNLQVERMQGQGYDGASNMRGEWNGLQALFLRDCSYAYYVHCFAHQLQLALVAASKKVDPIWVFFSSLSTIVNVICASPKRLNEFHVAQVMHITELVVAGECETGRGLNQIGTLHRPGATRWGSHFTSVCDLIDKYDATCTVLEFIMDDKSTESLRAEASGAYNAIRSFQFIFILHLLKEIMGLTDVLCRELQHKSQDILNAMNLVEVTVNSLQKLRENGWEDFLEKVECFCKQHDIDIPTMDGQHSVSTRRSYCQQRSITTEHHYRVDIFYAAIDFELVELNGRFSERAKELLILSSSLDPVDGFKAFNIDNICTLAEKFYPQDFTRQELHILRSELIIYESDVPHYDVLKNVPTLSELCRGFFETKRSQRYQMIDRLIRLVLTCATRWRMTFWLIT